MLESLVLALSVAGVAADKPEPPGKITASYRGKALPVSDAALTRLRSDLEQLVSTCSFASAAEPSKRHPELEVDIRYAHPRPFASALSGNPTLQLTQITLNLSEKNDDGWPLLFGVAPKSALQFAKCDGGKILDTLCVPELEAFTTPKLHANCKVAR